MSKKINSAIIGAAAEHYVMHRLLLHGMIAALAPKGVPEVDILVSNLDGASLAEIQVKGRQFSKDGGWTMNVKHENIIRDSLFYCFVDFENSPNDMPKCWVIPSAIVASVLKQSHKAWLDSPRRDGRQHQDWSMRRITHSYNHKSYEKPEGWLNSYREGWELISKRVEQNLK
jgi:hypothetical protein